MTPASSPRLPRLRSRAAAWLLTSLAWASGCAVTQPQVEPFFQSRTYTPGRIAVLPPTVHMMFDEIGDNDPRKGEALKRQVIDESMRLISLELRRRGYEVNQSARWDGVPGPDGSWLVTGAELARLANSTLMFANGEQGGLEGPVQQPAFIAPDMARKVGWATQSDAILYINLKGVVVSPGKITAQVLGAAAIVAVVVLTIILLSQSKGGGSSPSRARAPSGGAAPVASAPSGGGSPLPPAAGAPTTAAVVPRGRGSYGGGGTRYRHPPRTYSSVHVGVGVMVPLDGPTHTHEGRVAEDEDEDEVFAGDDLYVSMTLLSAHDGRVLWHVRENVDVEADQPAEMQALFRKYGEMIPPALGSSPKAGGPEPGVAAPASAAPAPGPGGAPPAPGPAR